MLAVIWQFCRLSASPSRRVSLGALVSPCCLWLAAGARVCCKLLPTPVVSAWAFPQVLQWPFWFRNTSSSSCHELLTIPEKPYSVTVFTFQPSWHHCNDECTWGKKCFMKGFFFFCSPWFLRCLFWDNKSFPFRSNSCLFHSSCFLWSLTCLSSSTNSSTKRKAKKFEPYYKKNLIVILKTNENDMWQKGLTFTNFVMNGSRGCCCSVGSRDRVCHWTGRDAANRLERHRWILWEHKSQQHESLSQLTAMG